MEGYQIFSKFQWSAAIMAMAVQSSCCAVLPGPVELLLILQDNILLVSKHLTAQLALQLVSGCLVDVFTSLATPAQSARGQINAETLTQQEDTQTSHDSHRNNGTYRQTGQYTNTVTVEATVSGTIQCILWQPQSVGQYTDILWQPQSVGQYTDILWQPQSMGQYTDILWQAQSMGQYIDILWQPQSMG